MIITSILLTRVTFKMKGNSKGRKNKTSSLIQHFNEITFEGYPIGKIEIIEI